MRIADLSMNTRLLRRERGMKKNSMVLVINIVFLYLVLVLASPWDISATTLPIDLNGCMLDTSGDSGTSNICDLGFVQFEVTQVGNITDPTKDNRIGRPYAKVAVEVEAIEPGDFQTQFVENAFPVDSAA